MNEEQDLIKRSHELGKPLIVLRGRHYNFCLSQTIQGNVTDKWLVHLNFLAYSEIFVNKDGCTHYLQLTSSLPKEKAFGTFCVLTLATGDECPGSPYRFSLSMYSTTGREAMWLAGIPSMARFRHAP